VDSGDRLASTVSDLLGGRSTDDICLADAIPPILDSFACTEDTTGGMDDTCTAVFSEPVSEASVKNLWNGWGGRVIDSGVLARAIDPSVDAALAVEISADRRTVTIHVDDLSKVDPTASNNTVTIDGVRDDYGNVAQDNGRFDVRNFHLTQLGVNGVPSTDFMHTAFGTGWGANDHRAAGLVDVFGPRLVAPTAATTVAPEIEGGAFPISSQATMSLQITLDDVVSFDPSAANDITNPANWVVEGLETDGQQDAFGVRCFGDGNFVSEVFAICPQTIPRVVSGTVSHVVYDAFSQSVLLTVWPTTFVSDMDTIYRLVDGAKITMSTSIEDINGNPVTVHNVYTYDHFNNTWSRN